jgi:hypothetical protein
VSTLNASAALPDEPEAQHVEPAAPRESAERKEDAVVNPVVDWIHLSAKSAPASASSILSLQARGSIASSARSEAKSWIWLMKNMTKKFIKKNITPLPVFARGISLHGHFECRSGQTAHISVTSEGLVHQDHLHMASCSCVHPDGDLGIQLSNVLIAGTAPNWTTGEATVTFEDVQHRDASLRMMRDMIAIIAAREQSASALLSSFEAQIHSNSQSDAELSQAFLMLLSPSHSAVLGALYFPYDGPSPPILPQLTRTIRILHDRYPDVMLKLIDGPVFQSRPLHYLIRSSFGVDVQPRAMYWLISAVADAASAVLQIKDVYRADDAGSHEDCMDATLIHTLIKKSTRKSAVFIDHDFELNTLQMLLRAGPSLASEPLSDQQGDNIFSRICSFLEEYTCPYCDDAYNLLSHLLERCPQLASQRFPSCCNQYPLHLLCCSNPQPRELQIVLESYPPAASSCDDDGILPIHRLVQTTTFPECIDQLLAAAPDCMTHHTRDGFFPIHFICGNSKSNESCRLKGRALELYLAAIIRGCHGCIVCDFHVNACTIVLKQMEKWVSQASSNEHYGLICKISVLDFSYCVRDESAENAVMIQLLLVLLPHCTSLTILDISGNSFSRDNIESLLPTILQLPKLQQLKLDGKPKQNNMPNL